MPAQDDDPKDPFRLGDDPGWRPGHRDGRPDGLVALRMTFLAVCSGLLVVGVVVGVLAADADRADGSVSPWVAAAAVAGVGVLGLLAVRFLPLRLDCSDELVLAGSWRSRFLGRVAAAEVAALAGFVAYVLTGTPALYPLGLVFSALGLAYAGPFRATLIRDQEQLALEECAIALVPALRHAVTRDRG
ncbi:hypothetical protein [Iamia sp.]|uniref:hypothetical protein n=1 Tax=Iamia sp. TaxID=2722710 RepID=UPI002CC2D016|nr:hypothetical protein [Iamia sp.]HXH57579.1 hypothetical protein [Iamia sp.]